MSFNLAGYLKKNADAAPDKLALVIPMMDGKTCVGEERATFSELSGKVASFQRGWKKLGLQKGDRVIVLFRPSVDLYAVVISLIALGRVPVFIDTGMPKKKILMALKDSNARVFISIKPLVRMFWIIPSLWRMKRFAVDGDGLGYRHISWLRADQIKDPFEYINIDPEDHGLISFTSGSTGRPKGADRTQGSLENQHLILRSHLPDKEGDIDMTSFPVWVLHNLCCGMTTVLPKVDLTRPGDVQPDIVVEQIEQTGVTRFSAAPAFMERLTRYLEESGKQLPDINLVFTGGATVPVELAARMTRVFPNALAKVVYGSTESEPISSVEAKEFVRDSGSQPGFLVGKPVKDVEVCVASLPDRPVEEAEVNASQLKAFDIGEILVSGEHVLKAYVDNVSATR
ncbi:MAG: AMP-binding protein, partial [Ketobacteraceae bacterium]|nr:AMP-binding protein [Ketobacteraceae bacterium]